MLFEVSREARRLLGWSQLRLALAADLALLAVVEFEAGGPTAPDVISAIRAALEAAGVLFIGQNGEGPGVTLRKSAG
jgi:transcriptional regulator with XRE-family HTH domain